MYICHTQKRINILGMKKIAMHWQIMIGILLGALFGWAMAQFSFGKEFVLDWIKPFGNMFINALKLIAVPLILASLIKGISDMKDISRISKMGGRTLGIYLLTTVIAVCLGMLLVNLIKPGNTLPEEMRNELLTSYQGEATHQIVRAQEQQKERPLSAIEALVPDNLIKTASDNTNMLQIIFCAIFFGLAMVLLPEEKTAGVKKFIDSLNDIILKLIDMIMKLAPFAVFALIAALLVEIPNQQVIGTLMAYAFTVLLGLLLMIILYGFFVYFFTKKSPVFFWKNIFPVQLLAFSTSSSSATLPVTMERVEEYLGVEEEVSSFVLPIGVTINMDGTSLYQAIAAVFIAQAFGIELSFAAQMGIIVTATLASIGSAGVPGAGIVMLVIVLAQAGIPEAGLALIFAVDRPLDMFRTAVNVTGDACVSMIVAQSVGKLNEPRKKD